MAVSNTVDFGEELARYAGVPVWNGLINEFHPTQVMADLKITYREMLIDDGKPIYSENLTKLNRRIMFTIIILVLQITVLPF